MIIKLQTDNQTKLLTGKALSFDQLQEAVDKHSDVQSNDFAKVFCASEGYRELPYAEGYADFVIDSQIRIVFVTRHTFPKKLLGLTVLHFTERGTFEPVYHAGREIAEQVYYLAICKADDISYSVFCINEKLKVIADGCINSIEDCKKFMDESGAAWYAHKDS